MDVSPAGNYAAFIRWDTHQIRIFDFSVNKYKDVPTFGEGSDCMIVWSCKEDTLYMRCGRENWEIVIEPVVAYRRLSNSPGDFANHFGRVGSTSSRDGARYTYHQDGPLKL